MADEIDQKIMAYADGALNGDEARRVEEMIASDPALAAKLQLFQRSSRARLAGLFTKASDRKVPEQLSRIAAELDKALRRPAMTKTKTADTSGPVGRLRNALNDLLRGASPGGWAMTLGASALALALLAGPILFAGVPASDPFRIALETAKSGEPVRYIADGGERIIVPVLSFRNQDDEFCRLYDLKRGDDSRLSGIACREKSGAWPIKLETETASAPAAGYTPASSAIPPVLGDAVETMIKGSAFGREEENAMLRRGWQQQ